MSDQPIPYCTVKGEEPVNDRSAPAPTNERLLDGQHTDHWTMCPGEIIKAGFVRPVRLEYIHEKCGGLTRMPMACAETYAANPSYYGSTFCCTCHGYFPVGANGEFVWAGTNDKVGT